MEEHAVYRVLMVEDDRGIAQAVQTQGELWNLQVRQACPASTATTGARRSAGSPGFR